MRKARKKSSWETATLSPEECTGGKLNCVVRGWQRELRERFLRWSRVGGFDAINPMAWKAGIASTFSPTHRAVLAEAFAFLRRLGAEIELLHCAERTKEKEQAFRESLAALGQTAEVVFLPGADPCAGLVAAAAQRGLSLLAAGALERGPQVEDRSFTGSVARRLLGSAPCDILLLPNPSDQPPVITRAFFALEAGRADAADFVTGVARDLQLTEVVLGVAATPFAAALAQTRGEKPANLEDWCESVAEDVREHGLQAEARVVDSNTGFGLCDAARACGAELLVARGKRHGNRLVLPSHLDWIRQVIPTRLFVKVE